MKNMKKLASILLALVMVFTMTTFAFAADDGSITITNPTAGETYKVYKLFDLTYSGTNVSYTYTKVGDADPLYDALTADASPFTLTIPNGGTDYIVSVKDGKTDDEIIAWVEENAALLAYVTEATASNAEPLVFGNLGYGYYYITSSLGSLVTIDSTLKDVEVTDKNTAPELNKTITGASDITDGGKEALAQLGTDVEFTVTIDVGAGAVKYVFHDELSAGLVLKADSITVVDNDGAAPVKDTDYTIAFDDGEDDANVDDITITFTDTYLATTTDTTLITITYKATITEEALSTDPEKNTAYLTYSNDPGEQETPPVSVEVYNAKFTVTKTDGTNALEGAGFVVKNAAGKYYKYIAATADASAKIDWVDSIEDATELTSDANGAVVNTELGLTAFTGLANGTYTLVEKTVPAGYNKAADQNFTIAEDNYEATNLEQEVEVINKSGSELPSTGGIGTTIFYVSGAVLAIAAVVFLVTKKRMSGEEE